MKGKTLYRPYIVYLDEAHLLVEIDEYIEFTKRLI